jgi:hypothetical protein
MFECDLILIVRENFEIIIDFFVKISPIGLFNHHNLLCLVLLRNIYINCIAGNWLSI